MNEELFIEEQLPRELSKEEFIEYFTKYNLGSFEHRDLLIIHNIKLVYYHIHRHYYGENYDKKELVSIGIIGLIRAVDTYDLNKGEFSTYAIKCINNEILQSFRKKQLNTISVEEVVYRDKDGDEKKLVDTISDENSDYTSQYEKQELYFALRKYIDTLDDISKQIIKLHFGFENTRRYTQREISEITGLCLSQTHRKLRKSLNIIKQKLLEDGFIESDIKISVIDDPEADEESKQTDRHKIALINKIFNKQTENLLPSEIEGVITLAKIYIELLKDSRNKHILKLYYGFYDGKENNYDKITNETYVGKANIAKIIQRTTDKIIDHFLTIGIIDNNRQFNKEKFNIIINQRIHQNQETNELNDNYEYTQIEENNILNYLKTISYSQLIEILTIKEIIVISLKLGYEDNRVFTDEEISNFLKIEKTEIANILYKAEQQLKNKSKSLKK